MSVFYYCLGLISGIIALCVFVIYKKCRGYWNKESKKNQQILRSVENSRDVIYCFQVKPQINFTYISPSVERFLGRGVLREVYQNFDSPFERVHPEDYHILAKKVEGDIDFNEPIVQRWRDTAGTYRWFEEYSSPIYEQDELVAVVGVMRNIDDKIELHKKLEYRATHDALTDLHNRAYFEEIMEEYENKKDVSMGMILCDLDELKQINDTYGHKKGDLLIRASAKLLKTCFPDTVIARIGGDEFVIILPGIDPVQGQTCHQELAQAIEEYNGNRQDIPVQMSLGYAYSEHSLGNMETLLVEADQRMYQDKEAKQDKNFATAR